MKNPTFPHRAVRGALYNSAHQRTTPPPFRRTTSRTAHAPRAPQAMFTRLNADLIAHHLPAMGAQP